MEIDVQYIADEGAVRALADKIDTKAFQSLKEHSEDVISLAKKIIDVATKYKKVKK